MNKAFKTIDSTELVIATGGADDPAKSYADKGAEMGEKVYTFFTPEARRRRWRRIGRSVGGGIDRAAQSLKTIQADE